MSACDVDVSNRERPQCREVHVIVDEHDVVVGEERRGRQRDDGKAPENDGSHAGESTQLQMTAGACQRVLTRSTVTDRGGNS